MLRVFCKYVTNVETVISKEKGIFIVFLVSVFLNMLKFCLIATWMQLKYYTIKDSINEITTF